jgi:hypothetical protein
MVDLIIKKPEEIIRDDISLRSLKDKPTKQIEYETEEKELSKNIQAFDKRPKTITENPFSYNSISLKKKTSTIPTSSASEMITNPTYNTIGKFLGVDTIHDWNKAFNKVFAIVEWAKVKSGEKETNKLMGWIGKQVKRVPNVGNTNLDNLYLFARLYLSKK